MSFYEHLTEFVGLPVEVYDVETGVLDGADMVYRVGFRWDETPHAFDPSSSAEHRLSQFLQDPESEEARGLIIGHYFERRPIYAQLLRAAPRLPHLKGLYIGEATTEEVEFIHLPHGDITPFLKAYPGLEDFRVRGAGIELSPLRHISLKRLVLESAGLDARVLAALSECVFPELEHLELYCGSEYFGWNASLEDVLPLIEQRLFPQLKYLGIRWCMIADEMAEVLAKSIVLDELDLSLGNLSDEGARALLDSDQVRKLKKLDLHHHYISEELMKEFQRLHVEVDLSEAEDADQFPGDLDYFISDIME